MIFYVFDFNRCVHVFKMEERLLPVVAARSPVCFVSETVVRQISADMCPTTPYAIRRIAKPVGARRCPN